MQSDIFLKAVKGNINMIDDHLIHTRMVGFATCTAINYLAKAYLTMGELCERTSKHDGPLDTQGLPCNCRYHILRFNKLHRALSLLYCIDGWNRNTINAIVYENMGFSQAFRMRVSVESFGSTSTVSNIKIWIWHGDMVFLNMLTKIYFSVRYLNLANTGRQRSRHQESARIVPVIKFSMILITNTYLSELWIKDN